MCLSNKYICICIRISWLGECMHPETSIPVNHDDKSGKLTIRNTDVTATLFWPRFRELYLGFSNCPPFLLLFQCVCCCLWHFFPVEQLHFIPFLICFPRSFIIPLLNGSVVPLVVYYYYYYYESLAPCSLFLNCLSVSLSVFPSDCLCGHASEYQLHFDFV